MFSEIKTSDKIMDGFSLLTRLAELFSLFWEVNWATWVISRWLLRSAEFYALLQSQQYCWLSRLKIQFRNAISLAVAEVISEKQGKTVLPPGERKKLVEVF
jgi:hypothetical protein